MFFYCVYSNDLCSTLTSHMHKRKAHKEITMKHSKTKITSVIQPIVLYAPFKQLVLLATDVMLLAGRFPEACRRALTLRVVVMLRLKKTSINCLFVFFNYMLSSLMQWFLHLINMTISQGNDCDIYCNPYI